MKKNDLILIGVVLLCSVLFYIGYNLYADHGETVIVEVDGEECGIYDLSEDQVIVIGTDGGNTLEIKDGEVYMLEADCPDGLCMHQGAISKDRESIICLPNKVVVEVSSHEEMEYDVVVQ